jgi:hypothetical protein
MRPTVTQRLVSTRPVRVSAATSIRRETVPGLRNRGGGGRGQSLDPRPRYATRRGRASRGIPSGDPRDPSDPSDPRDPREP